jgi:UDP-N-acetylmuramoyl-L-alanyl-D-glutamate--2,6-diaminopimelate ligase
MIRTVKNFAHYFNALLACVWYGFPGKHLTVVGITGTDGKTTTTHLVYEILKKAGKKVSMISSVYGLVGGEEFDTGFHVTTPDPWFLQKNLQKAVRKGDTYFILEVTSHGLDQNRTWGIPFTIGILTNITHEHLDYHKTYQQYVAAKSKLFHKTKTAIINCEDESYEEIQIYIPETITGKVITYGEKKGDLNLSNYSFTTDLPGDYNKLNCLAAAIAAKELGIEDNDIKEVLRSFSGVRGRFETVKTNKGFNVIIDFAHTPNALEKVLSTIQKTKKGKLIHVFGSAGLRDRSKRPKMGMASARYADISILTEEDYRTEDVHTIMNEIETGYKKELTLYDKDSRQGKSLYKIENRQDAINKAVQLAQKGDVLVLTGKGHEKSLCRGKKEYPWSDQEGVKRALQ